MQARHVVRGLMSETHTAGSTDKINLATIVHSGPYTRGLRGLPEQVHAIEIH